MFHEQYGELSKKQYSLYRKYNISPADHDELVDYYELDSDEIIVFLELNKGMPNLFI